MGRIAFYAGLLLILMAGKGWGALMDPPLCAEARRGKAQVVRSLIAGGAPVNQRCAQHNNTPLMLAVGSQSLATVDEIIKAGADLEMQNNYGNTALHFAAGRQSAEIVEVLLASGANPLVRNKKGETPLDVAGIEGRINNIRLLDAAMHAGGDTIMLKNGDILSGQVLTPEFIVTTSYGTLKYNLADVQSILYVSGKPNVEVISLKNGDKVSGRIGPSEIGIKLANGQVVSVEKAKIREIQKSKY